MTDFLLHRFLRSQDLILRNLRDVTAQIIGNAQHIYWLQEVFFVAALYLPVNERTAVIKQAVALAAKWLKHSVKQNSSRSKTERELVIKTLSIS